MANVYLREGRPTWEQKDCFVISLAYALNIHYSEAHDFCKKRGRKDKRGSQVHRILDMDYHSEKEFMGHKLMSAPWRGTVEKFKAMHPKGTYIVLLNNHA